MIWKCSNLAIEWRADENICKLWQNIILEIVTDTKKYRTEEIS